MPKRRPAAPSPKSNGPIGTAPDLALGIDLGATKVVSGLIDPEGRIVHFSGRHLHSNDGPSGVISTVVRSARACLDELAEPPRAVGIGVAAQVDPASGTVRFSPNLKWHDVPLGDRLAAELGTPVRVVNDARAAAFGEWRFGAGRGAEELFCMFVGTGVGGAAISGGRLVDGSAHSAGEIGHLTILSGGRRCGCGAFGCLEAYVGGSAIGERAREAARAHPTEAVHLRRPGEDGQAITAQSVFRAFRAGDPLATRIVEETERYLADGAVGIVNAFNPEVLVLGGGVIAGMPEFVHAVEAGVHAHALPPARGTRVVAALLGENAPLVGAAALAREGGWPLPVRPADPRTHQSRPTPRART